nr:10346_t:CDS:2 [Entrophospora candida]
MHDSINCLLKEYNHVSHEKKSEIIVYGWLQFGMLNMKRNLYDIITNGFYFRLKAKLLCDVLDGFCILKLLEAISPENLPKPLTPEHQNLGDLIISMPYVINWCKRNNKYYTTCHSFKKTKQCLNIEKRLIELYVHGVLHLLGYDHESDDDYLMMNMKEKEMLKQFWKWKKDLRNRK